MADPLQPPNVGCRSDQSADLTCGLPRLRADWCVRFPAVEIRHSLVGHTLSCIGPQLGPLAPVLQFTAGILRAARNESRKGRPPGGHADRLIAKVETPADAVALVRKRRMHRAPMKQ